MKLAQGMADQFAPIKQLSQKAYALARLSKGSSGAFEAFLHHGKLKLTDAEWKQVKASSSKYALG